MEKHPHDYRTRTDKGVELIVRPNNRYGAAVAGERVLVDAGEARNASTISACMTDAEFAELEAKRLAREEKAKQPAKNTISAAVEAGLARFAAEGAAKARAKEEQEQAEQLEREAAAQAVVDAAGDLPKRDAALLDLAKNKKKGKGK